jgi:hypothetical protein
MFKAIPDRTIRDNRKPVLNVTTGQQYSSLGHAAKETGTNFRRIREAIERKGTANGFKWEYVNKTKVLKQPTDKLNNQEN